MYNLFTLKNLAAASVAILNDSPALAFPGLPPPSPLRRPLAG